MADCAKQHVAGLGIKGKEELWNGWSAVFNASTGINPQSGQLSSALATSALNAGLPRSSYSAVVDGARAGQFFNDEIYAGASSSFWGALTFGRQFLTAASFGFLWAADRLQVRPGPGLIPAIGGR
jgi:predicted porin